MEANNNLWQKAGDTGHTQCNLCIRRCRIAEGKRGYCLTRENRSGTLHTLIYGQISSIAVSPIEKKPVFHFYPGSQWLSLGSLGCNFRCPGCQNWDIAHSGLDGRGRQAQYIAPETLVELALRKGAAGISWTYNEPTLWLEYTLDAALIAKRHGLFTNYVTNGSITPEALDLIGPYLDVFRVDIKAHSSETFYKLAHMRNYEDVLEATRLAKAKWNMHVEVVTNIIPTINDADAELDRISGWIHDTIGADTPWHVTRFVPQLYLSNLPSTSIKTLERAREIGMRNGLRFVYVGNVPGHEGENTWCPSCGKLLLRRFVFATKNIDFRDGKCAGCGVDIPIIGDVRDSIGWDRYVC